VNPIVLGAIIGSVPTVVTAGLAAWAASRVNNRTLGADHAKWLREKRSDIYVAVAQSLHEAQASIHGIERGDTSEEFGPVDRERRKFTNEHASDYSARLFAYGTGSAYETGIAASNAEVRVWKEARKELAEKQKITLDAPLKQAIDDFSEKLWPFLSLVVKELQSFRSGSQVQ
jgi:hypothetical protein